MLGGQITKFRSGFCLEQTQHFCCQKCHPKLGKQARANFAKLEQTEILNFFKFPLVLTRHAASCVMCNGVMLSSLLKGEQLLSKIEKKKLSAQRWSKEVAAALL